MRDERFWQTFGTDGQTFSRTSDSESLADNSCCWATQTALFKWLQEDVHGGGGDLGNTAEKGKGVFLSWKTWWSIEYCEFEDVRLKRKSSLFLSLCTTEAEMDTNYLYTWTFAFCRFLYKRKEKGEKQWFWRDAKIVFVTSVSQSQCHFLVDIILVNHVSYYIAVYLNVVVLFMVWTCVKGGDVRVSTGKCFIFVMKYIKLTYIQAGMMFISFLVFAFI